jgi:hypothetical protein
VQNVGTGVVVDAAVFIELSPRETSAAPVRYQATHAAASNKLFQAASINLPDPGWWHFAVTVGGSRGTLDVDFDVEAGEAIPSWHALWPWYGWPFLVIAIFAVTHFGRARSTPGKA